MKRILMLVLICAMLALPAGCDAKVTGENMQTAADTTQQVVNLADLYQKAAGDLALALKETGVIDPNIVAKIEKIQAEIDRVQPQVEAIARAVHDAPYSQDDDSAAVILKALQAANAASTPVNPYAGPIAILLSLVTTLLGIFAAKKKAEADANAVTASQALAKYQAHKQGVELTLKQAEADSNVNIKTVAALMYKNIGDARAAIGVS